MSKAKNNNGYLGVTKPILMSGPIEKDPVRTAEVEKYLSDVGLYESQGESVLREEVLSKLDQIKKATRISGYGEQSVHEANAKIFTFGSYHLGVHGPGADIDTLCVGPRHANRTEYFFRWLHDMLAKMLEVSELARAPVLRRRQGPWPPCRDARTEVEDSGASGVSMLHAHDREEEEDQKIFGSL